MKKHMSDEDLVHYCAGMQSRIQHIKSKIHLLFCKDCRHRCADLRKNEKLLKDVSEASDLFRKLRVDSVYQETRHVLEDLMSEKDKEQQ